MFKFVKVMPIILVSSFFPGHGVVDAHQNDRILHTLWENKVQEAIRIICVIITDDENSSGGIRRPASQHQGL